MIADVCGRTSRLAKVAPPLKSTRTKFSVSDECVSARPSTSVRSSSDLPEPVAPMTSPCGPMPPCADSLMSRSTGWPVGADADRHAQPVTRRARPPGHAPGRLRRIAEAQQVGQAEVERQRVGRLGGRRRHAQASSSGRASVSASTIDEPVGDCRARCARRGRRCSRRTHGQAAVARCRGAATPAPWSAPSAPVRSRTVTPWTRLLASCASCGTVPPSSDHDDVRSAAPGAGAEARAAGQRLAEHRLEREQVVADQPRPGRPRRTRPGSARAAAT